MVNCHVMAFYVGAVGAAAEANVAAPVMEQISLRHTDDDRRLCSPVQLGLRAPD